MTNREINILNICFKNEKISVEYLLNFFDISKRSLYYSLNNINFYLEKNKLDKICIKKNFLIYDKKNIEYLLNLKDKNYYHNKEDIMQIILLNSVFNLNGLNITKLAKSLNISRNTIKSYMNELNKNFYYEYSKGYFLNLSLLEKQKLLSKILDNKNIYYYTNKIIDINLINNIKNFIITIEKQIKLNLNEEIYLYVISSIYCLINYKQEKINTKLNFDKNKKDLEKIYIKFFNNSINFETVYDLLIGLSLTPNIEYWINESFLVGKLIKDVSDKININLTKDKILYDFLLSHIKVCIYRLKNKIILKDLIYKDLIDENDHLLNVIKSCLNEIENNFNIIFTNNEISLLAFHFNSSIERISNSNKKKVILVCGLGYGSSKVLEHNLKENFDIDIVDVLPAHLLSENQIINESIDYILTTIDLKNERAIKINPVLTNKDFENLHNLGIKRRKDKIKINDFLSELEKFGNFNQKLLKNYLTEKYNQIFSEEETENFLLNLITKDRVIFKKNLNNYKEAIEIIGNNLLKRNSIKKEYIKDMLNNIKKYGPYIVIENGIAIPHANSIKNVNKIDISILILEENLYFNSEKYANIFFCFCSPDKDSHLPLLNDFYNLILIPEFKKNIKNIKNFNNLKKYLKTILIDGRKNV